MKHASVIALTIIILCASSFQIQATGNNNANHSKWLQLPSTKLQQIALNDFNNDGRKDTALMCLCRSCKTVTHIV